ncbi:MAG: MFS transporter, partial [Pseudomonadota bacterium]
MRTASYPKQSELIAIATVLMATIALSIDVMLPALGAIALEFGVSDDNRRQLVIICLFVGLAGGQLFFGPLSDSIGRRPAIVIGAVVFAIGGLVCATASTFEQLLVGRILQGCGAAGPRIVTVALI